ncbi:formylmethionine deformylase [Methylobacterium sp. 4-46]|uniref:peptide deformylase n=1 Tax=unclassified Methylobacterium TaxID=2615210 RepID=UPI000165CDE5|nr:MULTISPECIES: peptide deformylase [Methylobacterium]ACA20441.1 formylmethionine deformylase [Methylobacterium sp. 4-46]WFT79611.1 peptide deformylase [Methylobacterium nodulans]
MAILPLLRYPDACLRRAVPPAALPDPRVAAFAADLAETLDAHRAIGLTGPHVGASIRLTVIRLGPGAPLMTCVNPQVVHASPETARHREGSVAMPGVDEEVERPARVRVRYQDLDGTAREVEAEGFLAACLQHEIDQLDGVFWTERLSRLRRERLLKRFARAGRS